MLDAAAAGDLGALLVVGANPVSHAKLDPSILQHTFLIVQDLFLTETAALADVVLPAASLYEKSGTVTNTFGDIQIVRKAADRAGVKPDFEILVRLAGGMGIDVSTLVPFGKRGTTGDLGQSRGAQSGEADRHSVWLEANGLEPKLSPFDPLAALDEIERLVPGYTLDRVNLFAGNDVHTEPASPGPESGFVPVSALTAPELVVPAHDTLFTSGALGRYSRALGQLEQHQANELAKSELAKSAAD
jgi:NADH-quinone oxidoreductase subunit G